MKKQIIRSSPKSISAKCRVCNQPIPKGEECVLFETYAAGKILKLFIHNECFKIQE
jgi:hypothetical protein